MDVLNFVFFYDGKNERQNDLVIKPSCCRRMVAQALLNLSSTWSSADEPSIMTVNPVMMVLDREPDHKAIGILLKLCTDGCSQALKVHEQQHRQQKTPAPATAASATVASSNGGLELKDNGAAADATEQEEILHGGRLAAEALACIAQDDWCRLALIQANALTVLVRMLESLDSCLQQHAAAAIAWLSGPPERLELDEEYKKTRTEYIKRFAQEHPTDDQWKPLSPYGCGWIRSNILERGALKPLMELISPDSGTLSAVHMHVAKVFANLASNTTPTRTQIINAGAIEVLVEALHNQLNANLHKTFSGERINSSGCVLKSLPVATDLLKALTEISHYGKNAKLKLAAGGFLKPLVGLLTHATPLKTTALEALRCLSECPENVPAILENAHALHYVTELTTSTYENKELQFQVNAVCFEKVCKINGLDFWINPLVVVDAVGSCLFALMPR